MIMIFFVLYTICVSGQCRLGYSYDSVKSELQSFNIPISETEILGIKTLGFRTLDVSIFHGFEKGLCIYSVVMPKTEEVKQLLIQKLTLLYIRKGETIWYAENYPQPFYVYLTVDANGVESFVYTIKL